MTAHAQHHTPGLWCSGCAPERDEPRTGRVDARHPTVRAIVARVCLEEGIKPRALFSDRRDQLVSWPRARIAEALRCEGFSFPAIGGFLGRDHSTIVYLVRKVRGAAT